MKRTSRFVNTLHADQTLNSRFGVVLCAMETEEPLYECVREKC